MSLIGEKDRELLLGDFEKLAHPVKLVLFVSDENCPYCAETKELLEEIVSLSPQLELKTYNLLRDRAKAAEFQIDKDHGIRYFGIPAGYEFGSLIDDILDVSKGESGLSKKTKEALAKLSQPLHFQVFVTPTCPYCPSAVRLAHQMAMESDWVHADMIEATEFPELAQQYEVMGVPRVVINGTSYFEGALPEADYVQAALQTLQETAPHEIDLVH